MLAPMAEEETVTIRDGIKSLGANALSECKNMKILNLPSSLNSIRGSTFSNIYQLETINFLNGNSSYMVDDGYLYSKDGKTLVYVIPTKTSVNIGETVENIGDYAIHGTNVTEVIISDAITNMSYYTFINTRNLEKIEIGSGVINLDPRFKNFAGIPNGLEITIDSENPYYKVEGNLILTKDGKEVVTYINKEQSQVVPEGVEKLQHHSFEDFTNATKIILPSSLREIGENAFIYCTALKEIKIPNNVNSIGVEAFANCNKLAEVRIDKAQGSISGSPWSVPKGERAIIWLR